MKPTKILLALLATGAGSACTVTTATAGGPAMRGRVTIRALEVDLDPYGEFVYVADHGRVWRPYAMPSDWQPYTRGHWALQNGDWTWQSDFAWGWATFHYGRWHHSARYGWVWVPGDQWSPAWVAWSYDDGYVSWAPLPPDAYWTGSTWSVAIAPRRWCWVRRNDFTRRHVHRVVRRRAAPQRVHRAYPAPSSSRRVRRAQATPAPRRAQATPAPRRRAHTPVVTHAPKVKRARRAANNRPAVRRAPTPPKRTFARRATPKRQVKRTPPRASKIKKRTYKPRKLERRRAPAKKSYERKKARRAR